VGNSGWTPEAQRQYRKDHPEQTTRYNRASALKKRYGITIQEYEDKFQAQGGKCASCGVEKEKLDVDHCHLTGRVRDLLCRKCNLVIGFIESERYSGCLNYVERWQVTP
jgi:hypothetical protein